jgi:hypothetical protein
MSTCDDLYSFPTKPFVQTLSDDDEEVDRRKWTSENDNDLSDVSDNLVIFTRNPNSKKRPKPPKYKAQKNQKLVVLDDSGDDKKPIEIGSDDEVC